MKKEEAVCERIAEEFSGERMLSGFEYGGDCCFLRVDDVVYRVQEGRGEANGEFLVDLLIETERRVAQFPSHKVRCERLKTTYKDVIEMRDMITGQVVLRLGNLTPEKVLPFLPYAVIEYYPENLAMNRVQLAGQEPTEKTPLTNQEIDFIGYFSQIANKAHKNSRDHGFYEREKNDGETLALIHSELSECLEALRDGNPINEKIPEITRAEGELADVILRIMDFSTFKDWNVGLAIVRKMHYNASRPYKHGKLF